MSGHSHWAGIKHKKAVIDAKRGKLWSKLARNILVAAKTGGPDPAGNLTLRYAIDKAKDANMPRETIEKTIKKVTGGADASNFEEVIYEGYGAHGVAIMVDVLTDNRNRTASEIRHIFERHGSSLGAAGCVGWTFKKRGVFTVEAAHATEDALMEVALDAGADDVQRDGDLFEITCAPDAYEQVKAALAQRQIPVKVAELSRVPDAYVTLNREGARKILGLMEELEDHDDVQNVYANFDIPPEIMKTIEAGA